MNQSQQRIIYTLSTIGIVSLLLLFMHYLTGIIHLLLISETIFSATKDAVESTRLFNCFNFLYLDQASIYIPTEVRAKIELNLWISFGATFLISSALVYSLLVMYHKLR